MKGPKLKRFSINGLIKLLVQITKQAWCDDKQYHDILKGIKSMIDSNKKEMLLSSAGHEPPIILSEDGVFTNYTEAGPPLGIMPQIKYKESLREATSKYVKHLKLEETLLYAMGENKSTTMWIRLG